jgi:hypothetical protein
VPRAINAGSSSDPPRRRVEGRVVAPQLRERFRPQGRVQRKLKLAPARYPVLDRPRNVRLCRECGSPGARKKNQLCKRCTQKRHRNRMRRTGRGFERQLADLGYPSYAVYLRSLHWMEVRARQPKTPCVRCGRRASQLHHQTYERLGDERPEDLAWLCQICHRVVHRKPNNDLRVVSVADPR